MRKQIYGNHSGPGSEDPFLLKYGSGSEDPFLLKKRDTFEWFLNKRADSATGWLYLRARLRGSSPANPVGGGGDAVFYRLPGALVEAFVVAKAAGKAGGLPGIGVVH